MRAIQFKYTTYIYYDIYLFGLRVRLSHIIIIISWEKKLVNYTEWVVCFIYIQPTHNLIEYKFQREYYMHDFNLSRLNKYEVI